MADLGADGEEARRCPSETRQLLVAALSFRRL